MQVPIPDDFDASVITVAGTHDHDYGEADVNVDGRRHCRNVTVPDDADSVGVSSHYAGQVADYLGVSVQAESDASARSNSDVTDGSAETDADTGGTEAAEIRAAIDAGECPWCEDYDGDHVGQHASSAHPDEWAAYKEGES